MTEDFEKELKIFSANVNTAARAFYYHREINDQVYQDGVRCENLENGCFQDSKLFQAMQANAQFWNDYEYSSIQCAIITLGRIFDKKRSLHKLGRLIKLAKTSEDFKKENLRKRKIEGSDNHQDWIDGYMDNVHELDENDFLELEKYTSETQKLWDNIKDIRHKMYAHQEVLSDDDKSEIIKKAEYTKIEEIIQRLFTLEHILWEAFHNGRNPNFNFKNTGAKERAQKEISSLLSRLPQNFEG